MAARCSIALVLWSAVGCRPIGSAPAPGDTAPIPYRMTIDPAADADGLAADAPADRGTTRRTGGMATASADTGVAVAKEVVAGLSLAIPSADSVARLLAPLRDLVRFRSRADSLAWVRARAVADTAREFRVVVSLQARRVWVLRARDTVFQAPVSVGMDTRLVFGARTWTFETPRGIRRVLRKAARPVWTPPLWHYVEEARRYGLALRELPERGRYPLSRGRWLSVRDSLVGIESRTTRWAALPVEDHIVFHDTLYMPPPGTRHRRMPGQLGPFKLELGDGYMFHGTPDQSSIGRNTTHGCIRLRDDDLAWLYEHVPVGTRVFIL